MASIKQEDSGLADTATPSTAVASPEPGVKEEEHGDAADGDRKRKKPAPKAPKKTTEEILQRRREGRLKAQATIAQNLKRTGIGRFEDSNGFPATSIMPVLLINQKNYFADYLKKDEQAFLIRNWRNEKLGQAKDGAKDDDGDEMGDDDDEQEDMDEKAKMGYDTIVVHPGADTIKIGRATAAEPVYVPMRVAIKKTAGSAASEEMGTGGADAVSENFDTAKAAVFKDFKARMRYYKRRLIGNGREQAATYNRIVKPETVEDASDPEKRQWFLDADLADKTWLAGSDALKVPDGTPNWHIRTPVVAHRFNQEPYVSSQELMGDLLRVMEAAVREAGIELSLLALLKCMLVIPDLYDKVYVERWCDILLNAVGFGRVGVIQEAVAATFGAGVSCACVVDVGALKTKIACVDEGLVINESRLELDYGGTHITEALGKMLNQIEFPLPDMNLQRRDDFRVVEDVKRQYGTFDDADITVQTYSVHRRRAGFPTEKIPFKVYDETMLAPLGLFFPQLFEIPANRMTRPLIPESVDHYTGEPDDPTSKTQENAVAGTLVSEMADANLLLKLVHDRQVFKQTNVYARPKGPPSIEDVPRFPVTTPLDKAIIELITNAGIVTDFNRMKKLYDNILVVGGGLAKFPNADALLNDRVNIWRPKYLSSSSLDEMVTYVARELDKAESKKKQLIAEAKGKRKVGNQALDNVLLPPEELAAIDDQTFYAVDLTRTDAIFDTGTPNPVTVLPQLEDTDPRDVTWRGGSVFSRLKVVNEMWFTQQDWALLSTRCISYKTLLNY